MTVRVPVKERQRFEPLLKGVHYILTVDDYQIECKRIYQAFIEMFRYLGFENPRQAVKDHYSTEIIRDHFIPRIQIWGMDRGIIDEYRDDDETIRHHWAIVKVQEDSQIHEYLD